MAKSVDRIYWDAGALLESVREAAAHIGRLPEDAPLRATFRGDIEQLILELTDLLDELDDTVGG